MESQPYKGEELAELAGTTVNAIRHYHRVGLLEELTRRYNGYTGLTQPSVAYRPSPG
ncbi:MerR family DNA-binding transcriptional regulator [Micromonospora chokoriensis]